jgi:hypothetical protein
MKVTLISFAPNFMLVTTSKVCANSSRPFPSKQFLVQNPSITVGKIRKTSARDANR